MDDDDDDTHAGLTPKPPDVHDNAEPPRIVRYKLMPPGTQIFAALGRLVLLSLVLFTILWEFIKLFYGYQLTLWLDVTNAYNASYAITLRS